MRKNRHAALRKRTFPLDKRTTVEVEATRKNDNRKPYRTAAMKAEARDTAVKCKDGAYRSTAPVRFNNVMVRR